MDSELDDIFFALAKDLPPTIETSRDIAKVISLFLKKTWDLTPDIVLMSTELNNVMKDKELDPYIICFTYLWVLLKKQEKPLSRYIINDNNFKWNVSMVNRSFFGSSRTPDFHFAKYYYQYFVLYAKSRKIAAQYDEWLGRYEDWFAVDDLKGIRVAKEQMERLIGG